MAPYMTSIRSNGSDQSDPEVSCEEHMPQPGKYGQTWETDKQTASVNSEVPTDLEAAWSEELANLPSSSFPRLRPGYDPHCTDSSSHQFQIPASSADVAVVAEAAWCLIFSAYNDLNDLVYLTTLRGADSSSSVYPKRVQLQDGCTVQQVYDNVRKSAARLSEMKALGIERIGQLTNDARIACASPVLLAISNKGALKQEPQKNADSTNDLDSHAFKKALALEFAWSHDEVDLRLAWDSAVFSRAQTQRLADQIAHTVRTLMTISQSTKVSDVDLLCVEDQKILSLWNCQKPWKESSCLHVLFHSIASQIPDKVALSSTQGSMTYGDLDALSTNFAGHLRTAYAIGPEQQVVVCFTKSIWYFVAVLGILKCGASWVPLDTSWPKTRAINIISQVKPALAICSVDQALKIAEAPVRYVLDPIEISKLPSVMPTCLPRIDSDSSAAVFFTSGSTGIPKGVVITHSGLASIVLAGRKSLGTNQDTTILQFAPYAVGASLGEIFMALLSGARLCVITDTERAERLPMFVAEHKVNMAIFTPTIAARMPPFAFPSLKTVLLGSERMTEECISSWAGRANLIQIYGSTEVGICTWKMSFGIEDHLTNAGQAFIGRIWIVKRDNCNVLASIGEVGEILIEGHHLASGYFGDPDKTAASFIRDPLWSIQGPLAELFNGCDRRFYRSGDFASLNADGCIELTRRRDTQLKIRGQRVECEEVEAHVRSHIKDRPFAVEGVVFDADKNDTILVLFLAPSTRGKPFASTVIDTSQATRKDIASLSEELQDALSAQLPTSMVPAVVLPVTEMPLSASGKIDRRLLKSLAQALGRDQVFSFNVPPSDITATASDTKATLVDTMRQLWADTIGIKQDLIVPSSSFFRLGGDSLSAMKLIALANEHGLPLTVAQLVRAPVLSELVADLKRLGVADQSLHPSMDSFGLISDRILTAREASEACNLGEGDIEDIYPASALQEGLIGLGLQHTGSYVAHFKFKLPEFIDFDRLRGAIDLLCLQTPILRTRMYQTSDGRMMQVIVRQIGTWQEFQDEEAYLQQDKQTFMRLGAPLIRCACNPETRTLILTFHHAIYDAWTLRLLFHRVIELFRNPEAVCKVLPMNRFIGYLGGMDETVARQFWRSRLHGASAPLFPPLSEEYKAARISRQFGFIRSSGSAAVNSTIIQGALSLALARYSDSNDVVFGEVRSGRNLPIPGVLSICGPTIATVPIRTVIRDDDTIESFLLQTQAQCFETGVFEQWGLQNIRRVSEHARAACDLRTLLVVQNAELDEERQHVAELGCELGDEIGQLPFKDCPLVLQCMFLDKACRLDLNYDANSVPDLQASRLLEHLERIMHGLNEPDKASQPIGSLAMSVEADHDDIRQFNSAKIEPISSCLHHLFEQAMQRSPTAEAVIAPDGTLSYEELDRLAELTKHQLHGRGVTVGDIVPILFEKSLYAVVAMLGVLKSGAAYCPLDADHPKERTEEILKDLSAKLIITSTKHSSYAASFDTPVAVLSSELGSTSLPEAQTTVAVTPAHRAYCLFTSGSSGKPKGVLTSHQAISTSVTCHAALGFNSSIRILQFAAFTFDISVVEIFSTLTSGGCVCMASETQRLEDLPGSVHVMKINCAILTPTFAGLIAPEYVPSITVLVLGGEPVRKELIQRWAGKVRLINAYGVTEASVCNMLAEVEDPNFSERCIGKALASHSWVVDSRNHNQLVPVGLTGELAIEGPILADGYLKDMTRTKAAFIVNPDFFEELYPSAIEMRRIYLTGDLVRQRKDGSIDFIGRKDTQVKLRGLRIELGEIEYEVQKVLGAGITVAAEVIMPQSRPDDPIISLFLGTSRSQAQGSVPLASQADLESKVQQAYTMITRHLPAYMLPASFHLLKELPLLSSGKVDRKSLRALGAASDKSIPFGEIATNEPIVPVSSEQEKLLRSCWSTLLGLDEVKIGKQTSFFRAGGDSIIAIRLSVALRKQGFELNVMDIVANPKLTDMASKIVSTREVADSAPSPFELLSHRAETIKDVTQQLDIGLADIEDILRATALQEGFMADSTRVPGTYMIHSQYKLASSIDVTIMERAFQELLTQASITRTRIVNTTNDGMVQVIMRHPGEIVRIGSPDVSKYTGTIPFIGIGHSIFRVAFIGLETTDERSVIISAHHAAYDGWSLINIWRYVLEAYYNRPRPNLIGLSSVVRTIQAVSAEQSQSFWKTYLAGAPAPTFPMTTKGNGPGPVTNAEYESSFHIRNLPAGGDYTAAHLVEAAYGFLLSIYEGTTDSTYALISSGRNMNVPGIDQVTGPTLAVFPMRVRYQANNTIQELLHATSKAANDPTPHQHFGLQNIRMVSEEARSVVPPRTMLVFQANEDAFMNIAYNPGITLVRGTVAGLHACPFVFICAFNESEARINVGYDSNVISAVQVEQFVKQFDHIFNQLASHCSNGTQMTLNQLELVSGADHTQIERWQSVSPVRKAEHTVHELIGLRVRTQPDASAICAWDSTEEITYYQMDDMSDRLAQTLIEAGILPGDVVGFCFDKSYISIVAIMAILKSGGIWTPLNPSFPRNRLQSLAEQVSAQLCLTDSLHEETVSGITPRTMVITREYLASLPPRAKQLPKLSSGSSAYIMFTSGSTGIPKAVRVSHMNLCSALPSHATVLQQDPKSRFFQYTAFTWDPCAAEILGTLLSGGCICIPSETDRMYNLAQAIKSLRANQAFLTPTVAKLLDPATTTLEALCLGGETVPIDLVHQWRDKVKLSEAYGPVETTIFCAGIPYPREDFAPGNIGTGLNCFIWLVDLHNTDRLAPVGAIGEICIDGPIVAEYLGLGNVSRSNFIDCPSWASRNGDPERKLYLTGDLGSYLPNGSVRCLGRQDTQVKIHGQRLDLEEINLNLRKSLLSASTQACAEVIHPKARSTPLLVAFLSIGECADSSASLQIEETADSKAKLKQLTEDLEEQLARTLPAFMIPRFYLPVNRIPRTDSQKIDHKALKALCAELGMTELEEFTKITEDDTLVTAWTKEELLLRRLWSKVLGVQQVSIFKHSGFFTLGGDSVLAVRLVSAIRLAGYELDFAQTFQTSSLHAMASQMVGSQPRCSDL